MLFEGVYCLAGSIPALKKSADSRWSLKRSTSDALVNLSPHPKLTGVRKKGMEMIWLQQKNKPFHPTYPPTVQLDLSCVYPLTWPQLDDPVIQAPREVEKVTMIGGLQAMASTLVAMASNLIAMAFKFDPDLPQPETDCHNHVSLHITKTFLTNSKQLVQTV